MVLLLRTKSLALIFLLGMVTSTPYAQANEGDRLPLGRSGFPPSFIFGTSPSAYKYEGAAREGDKGSSICDTFTHQHPGLNLCHHALHHHRLPIPPHASPPPLDDLKFIAATRLAVRLPHYLHDLARSQIDEAMNEHDDTLHELPFHFLLHLDGELLAEAELLLSGGNVAKNGADGAGVVIDLVGGVGSDHPWRRGGEVTVSPVVVMVVIHWGSGALSAGEEEVTARSFEEAVIVGPVQCRLAELVGRGRLTMSTNGKLLLSSRVC